MELDLTGFFVISYLAFNMLLLLINIVFLFFIYKFDRKGFDKMLKPSKYEKKVWYQLYSKIVTYAFFPVFIIIKIFDIWIKEKVFYED